MRYVVLYLHSTSNHNLQATTSLESQVVLYLHSTSNHNEYDYLKQSEKLYYIFILHQTTTVATLLDTDILLYYIFILHQTTTMSLYK